MKEKCKIHKSDNLSYLMFFEDCEERTQKGQEQIRCPECKLYIWEDQF